MWQSYHQRASLDLSADANYLVERYYKDFVPALCGCGAEVPSGDRPTDEC